jgi:glycosyltransferase involved in cell wall biosynthesis
LILAPLLAAGELTHLHFIMNTKPRILTLINNEIVGDGRVQRIADALAAKWQVRVLGIDRVSKGFRPEQMNQESFSLDCRWIRLRILGRMKRNLVVYFFMCVRVMSGMIWHGWRFRPAVVIAHEPICVFPAKWIARLTGAKLIYDAHELYREWPPSFLLNIILRQEDWALQHADLVIACNHYRAEIMRDEYGARELPKVIPNYVPFHEYHPDDTLKRYAQQCNASVDTVVLYQGGIQTARGLDTLVSALLHLPKNVAVVFVGGYERNYIRQLQEQATELGVEGRCLFYGGVTYDELCKLSASADVGVVTYLNVNRNNYYCAPNKLYEYTMAGVPIIGADLPPIRSFLEATQTGVLFDPEDAQSCAQAILAILEDPQRRSTYHENGLKHAPDYCWERVAPKLTSLVASLLEGGASPLESDERSSAERSTAQSEN